MNIQRSALRISFIGLSLAGFIFACSSSSPNPGDGSGGTGPSDGSGGTGPGPTGTGGDGVGGTPGPGTGGAGDPGTGGAGDPGGVGGAQGTGGAPEPEVVVKPPLVTSGQGPGCAPSLEGCSYWRTDGTVTESTAAADVTVSDTTRQVFVGFGGSFNEEGWQNLLELTAEEQAKAIELLFGAANGANFTYGRIPIGASDYAVAPRYSLKESAEAPFSIERDKQLLIPFIKAAQARSDRIHFWASPWSPPPWMKSNNNYDGGNMNEDAATLQAFAEYLADFVTHYAAEGITIEAIHPQNEPGFQQTYPSCGWTGAGMANLIANHLGPLFEERGITADIFLGTMSNSSSDATLLQTVNSNTTAKSYIKGYGLQWGMLSVYGSLGMDSSLQIWQTEHKCGNYPFGGQSLPPGIPGSIASHKDPAPNDHAYAEESWGLIREWIKAGVTSYSSWNMVLDSRGVGEIDTQRIWAQNALLTVNLTQKTLNLTPTYFVFRHLSQYVDPGATRLDTTGGDALAFRNKDNSVTVALYNSGAARDITVAALGKNYTFAVPERGWATLNVEP